MNLEDDSGRFDLKSALARFSGDSELLYEAIAIFKEESIKHLEKIKISLKSGSLTEVVIEAHTLKGECGAVGAVAAHFMSESLEKAAQTNNMQTSNELYSKVEEEVQIAIDELPELEQ